MARRPADDDEDDDGDDDDKQYVVTGDELKKLVRLGRKRPMPFAFCPSAGDDESLFATHRKKPAKKIGKATRADSGQLKVAYGTFVIVDRVMVLTCERELPSIAKKLKKHMRAERLPLNIRVLDASGREVESDIEDLTGEDDPFADLGEDDDDGDYLLRRLQKVGDVVMAARGNDGDRLRDLMATAIRATEAGSRDKAQKLVALVERDVRRLMMSAARPAGVPMPDLPTVDDEEDEEEVEDEPPRASAAERLPLARRLNALRDRAEATGDAADRLMQALGLAARTLRDGDAQGAAEAMDRIEAAIERVEARSSA
jgi:hypothetical protein